MCFKGGTMSFFLSPILTTIFILSITPFSASAKQMSSRFINPEMMHAAPPTTMQPVQVVPYVQHTSPYLCWGMLVLLLALCSLSFFFIYKKQQKRKHARLNATPSMVATIIKEWLHEKNN